MSGFIVGVKKKKKKTALRTIPRNVEIISKMLKKFELFENCSVWLETSHVTFTLKH